MTARRPNRFFSQNGEDAVLFTALGGSEGPRFFVEVGVIDGMRFSNSLLFERLGWTGLCVEPHPVYGEMAKRNRRCRVISAAAGPENGASVPFYAEQRGALSGTKPESEAFLRKKYKGFFTGFEKTSVEMRTLDSLLEEVSAPTNFEFVSIDVEGAELDVLEGFDLSRWSPRVVLMEASSDEARDALTARLSATGYTEARRLVSNVFFARDEADARALRDAVIERRVRPTRHPEDRWTNYKFWQRGLSPARLVGGTVRLVKSASRAGSGSVAED